MNDICPICKNPLGTGEGTCTVCGFKLMGQTIGFEPITLPAQGTPASPARRCATASLRVVRGPQIETVFTLQGAPGLIGRNPRCDIFLNDMTVSREHARIEPGGQEGYRVVDMNSYNGVWINNKSVEEGDLADGDIVQIGAFCLLYQISEDNH